MKRAPWRVAYLQTQAGRRLGATSIAARRYRFSRPRAGTLDPKRLLVRVWPDLIFGCRTRKRRRDVGSERIRTDSGVRLPPGSSALLPATPGHPGNDVRPSTRRMAIGSPDPALTTLIKSDPRRGRGSAAVIRCRAAEATQRCRRRVGESDLGSGHPHRFRHPAPEASDPPSGGDVGP
jgi:hypothetical protein